MTTTETEPIDLPRWSVADVHDSLESRTVNEAMERLGAEATRLVALFDEHDIRAIESRPVTADDGAAADAVIDAYNGFGDELQELGATVHATVTTDSRDEVAQSLASRLDVQEATIDPLLARLADWVHALGVDELATVSEQVAEHRGPLSRLDDRAGHQMSESDEGLYAELRTTGSGAWGRLMQDVTSQLTTDVEFPDGRTETMPMPAVRGLATSTDPLVRRAAYDAEMRAWPAVATPVAAAMNAIKGEANSVNRGGITWHHSHTCRPRSRGPRASTGSDRRSPPTAASSRASSTVRWTSSGSTPNRETARPAVRSACRSPATARSSC